MRAVELVKDLKTKEPNPALARDLIRYGYERGLVLMSAGTYSNVLRLLGKAIVRHGGINLRLRQLRHLHFYRFGSGESSYDLGRL